MNNLDRASRAWQAGKERKTTRSRPELDRVQRIEFLELVAQMASQSTFERKLGLTGADVVFYKKELDIESQDEARRLARKLRMVHDDEREANVIEQTAKAREAEQIAQARLEALEAKRATDSIEKTRKKPDINKIRQEDAERNRRFLESQAGVEKPEKDWRLPIAEGEGTETEQIDRFRRAIVYHGLSFTAKRYGATAQQIKYEAARRGLKINWDIVRR